jgi:cellulose synthase/poly-beta-1,6-N-acetylglucosamine synthase-like glycosyltransferase
MVRRQASWEPALAPFAVTFVLVLAVTWWTYDSAAGPISWVTTVVWTLPVISSTVGMVGALLTRRRMRRQRSWEPARPAWHDILLVVVPTIGRIDTYPALERSVLSYCAHLPPYFPHFRVDIITEEGCAASHLIDGLAEANPRVRVVVVPKSYRTPNGTRFKARANHYSHELRIAEGEAAENVWVLHMDDDTGVGPDTARSLARFINAQRRAGLNVKHLAQGILAYPRENAVNKLTWLADAVRPADDIARFAAFTGRGIPLAGLHGELLLIRSSVEATIGWDFGPDAIVEDAQLALTFCRRYPGHSDWFAGHCYGASPATVRDLVKQRERWAWGLLALALNRDIPMRHRVFLGYCVSTWVVGPLQHIGVILAAGLMLNEFNTSPLSVWVLPLWALNIAYIFWMYWEGLKVNANVSADVGRRWWEPVCVLLLIPVFSLWEGLGGFLGFLRVLRAEENQFVVIAKPA